jgi:hypothetical protein
MTISIQALKLIAFIWSGVCYAGAAIMVVLIIVERAVKHKSRDTNKA